MRIVTYDLETLHTIEAAGGWNAHDKLGVSVLCACVQNWPDTLCGYLVFADELNWNYCETPSGLSEIRRLRAFQSWVDEADLLVGFNNTRFDNKVLAHNGINIPEDRCYDLLVESWCAQNLPLDSYKKETHSGGLDDYAKENLGEGKSGTGELAPRLWAQGRYGEVLDYCLRDVRLTKGLFDLICARGWLRNPKTGRDIHFPRRGYPPSPGDMLGLKGGE
jgi:hypothetical protein